MVDNENNEELAMAENYYRTGNEPADRATISSRGIGTMRGL